MAGYLKIKNEHSSEFEKWKNVRESIPSDINAGSYWVVKGADINELATAVEPFIVFGWKPIGGVSCVLIPEGTKLEDVPPTPEEAWIQYSQALTHHEWDAFNPDVMY